MALFSSPAALLFPHYLTNMLPSKLCFLNASLNPTRELLPLLISSSLLFVMLKTHPFCSFPCRLLSLSVIVITKLYLHLKRIISLRTLFAKLLSPALANSNLTSLLHRSCHLFRSLHHLLLLLSFAFFFTGKIDKLRLSLAAVSSVMCSHSPSPSVTPPQFSTFGPASESEISTQRYFLTYLINNLILIWQWRH